MKPEYTDHIENDQASDNVPHPENGTWGRNQELREKNEAESERNELQEELMKLQDQLQEKDAIIEEYLSMLQRLQAEFQNYKKRVERERSAVMEQATGDLICNLLLVLDNFERALQSDASDIQSYRKGVEMIFSQFQKVLEAEGLSPIPAVGEHFDPYYHEAVLTAQGDYEDDTIVEELEKGYLLNNRVLRPSKVKVGKRGD
ncbi:MAG: nucleotide exchange factor GrpE [Theionarchaea archaeon]|nr:nucleotide exchange factor GrpE [Theionarchaea archaeon]